MIKNNKARHSVSVILALKEAKKLGQEGWDFKATLDYAGGEETERHTEKLRCVKSEPSRRECSIPPSSENKAEK